MKAKVLPVYFKAANQRENKERKEQIDRLKELYGAEADFLQEQELGTAITKEVDLVLFPQLIGEAFCQRSAIEEIGQPVIVLTAEFGTVEMWDWEIIAYFRNELKRSVFAPYTVQMG